MNELDEYFVFMMAYDNGEGVDQTDPQFISLREELERLFKQKKLSEVKQEEMNQNISSLNKIHEEIKE